MALCQEIRDTVRVFTSFSIFYIGREGNNLALICAKQASADRGDICELIINPSFLNDTLLSDCNPLE
jgi:hypothetical protein